MKLSIVIPCYNEEEILPLTLERLNKLSNEWISRDDLTEIEFVFVDDGSQDRTYDLLTETSKADQRVKVVRFSRNFGHQVALLAGYELAQGDVIVSLDADLQDPPELIGSMLVKIKEGFDVVYAVRKTRGSDSLFKRKTADIFYWLMKKFGANIVPNNKNSFIFFYTKIINCWIRLTKIDYFSAQFLENCSQCTCAVFFARTTMNYQVWISTNHLQLNIFF